MHKKTFFFHIDWFLVLPILILVLFSLATLGSIKGDFFKNQLLFFIIGAFLFLFFSKINYRILQLYARPMYLVSLILLILLSFVSFEHNRRGAVRWISFLGFGIQFSELIKPFLILSLSCFLTDQPSRSFKKFALVFLFLAPIAFLIYRQPDLGTAVIYVLTVVGMLIIYGFPFWWFVSGLVSFVIFIPVIIPHSWKFLNSYQQDRILTFLDPTHDPIGKGYNVIQSMISVGSGGILGKGLGQGTQSSLKFLPERQTDFLFATLSEMLGFMGSAIVIVAFMALLYRLFILIHRAEDNFCKIFISGAFLLIFIQFFINIGMNISIIPIVGVTLPFMSYGGSSFIANAILLGLVSAMSQKQRNKEVLEIR